MWKGDSNALSNRIEEKPASEDKVARSVSEDVTPDTPISDRRNALYVRMKDSQVWRCELPFDDSPEGLRASEELRQMLVTYEQNSGTVLFALGTAVALNLDQPHTIPSFLFCCEYGLATYPSFAKGEWANLNALVQGLKNRGFTAQTRDAYDAIAL